MFLNLKYSKYVLIFNINLINLKSMINETNKWKSLKNLLWIDKKNKCKT